MKYTKEQLSHMAKTYMEMRDTFQGQQLIQMMNFITGLHPNEIERRIKQLIID